MVAGMTPATVKGGFVRAVLATGYDIEGRWDAKVLRAKVAGIQSKILASVASPSSLSNSTNASSASDPLSGKNSSSPHTKPLASSTSRSSPDRSTAFAKSSTSRPLISHSYHPVDWWSRRWPSFVRRLPSTRAPTLCFPSLIAATARVDHTKETAGILTVQSELGEPIHEVANRGVKLWKGFDDTVFKMPKEKQLWGVATWVDPSVTLQAIDFVVSKNASTKSPVSFNRAPPPRSSSKGSWSLIPMPPTQCLLSEDELYVPTIDQRPGRKSVPLILTSDAAFEVWFKKVCFVMLGHRGPH